MADPKCSGNRGQMCMTLLAIHRKFHESKIHVYRDNWFWTMLEMFNACIYSFIYLLFIIIYYYFYFILYFSEIDKLFVYKFMYLYMYTCIHTKSCTCFLVFNTDARNAPKSLTNLNNWNWIYRNWNWKISQITCNNHPIKYSLLCKPVSNYIVIITCWKHQACTCCLNLCMPAFYFWILLRFFHFVLRHLIGSKNP